MGIVYRAYDHSLGREVAIKTLKESPDQTVLDQFRKECDIQKTLHHPNIIEIYDYGVASLDGSGTEKPYLVMPLMEGCTLDRLIRDSSPRLTVENVVEMMVQVCRGMQAAHDLRLVHRDLKPSNLYVLQDDSVKIIDFGVARLVDQKSSVGLKGTPLYMSPEQIRMIEATNLSDIFSMGVVCYEALTGRRPFEGGGREDVATRILRHSPPPAHTFNPAVSPALSQVIHAALAKKGYNRFASARDFAEALKKGYRNEPIERFNPTRVQPRLDKARKAIDEGDYEFAGEIIGALEAESCIHPEVEALRRQVDRSVRERLVQQLLESARKRLDEQLLDLAYQKVQEALNIDPENRDAVALKTTIDGQRNEQQVQEWFQLARQHIDNYSYKLAKQALQNVIDLTPNNIEARQLLSDAEHRESEYLKVRQRKESLYKEAYDNWERGEVSSALSKIEQVIELDEHWPDAMTPEFGPGYQDLYNQVRSAHEAIKGAYEAARRHLSENSFEAATSICEEYREKYPQHPLFQGLLFDIEERRRHAASAYIARVDKEVEQEPDLNRRVAILDEAMARYPVAHFEQSLRTIAAKRDLVNGIVGKARRFEESGHLTEAVGQWEILRTIHGRYPGLEQEIESLQKRREQQVIGERKAHLAEEIDHYLALGEFGKAGELAEDGRRQYPDEAEFDSLAQLARRGLADQAEARALLDEARGNLDDGRVAEGLDALRRAREMDRRDPAIRMLLVHALLAEARRHLDGDWRRSEQLVQQAADIDPTNPLIKGVRGELADKERSETVDGCIREARRFQTQGDLVTAITQLDRGLGLYPQEPRLQQVRAALEKALLEKRQQTRERDLEEARTIARTITSMQEPAKRVALQKRAGEIQETYAGDTDFRSIFEPLQATQDQAPSIETPAPSIETPVTEVPSAGETRSTEGRQTAAVRLEEGCRRLRDEVEIDCGQRTKPLARALGFSDCRPAQVRPHRRLRAAVCRNCARGVFGSSAASHTSRVTKIPITVAVLPAEAAIRVDGKQATTTGPIELEPGTHSIEAALDGYESVVQRFDVTPTGTQKTRTHPGAAAALCPDCHRSTIRAGVAGWRQDRRLIGRRPVPP